jgi:hypothetical protein
MKPATLTLAELRRAIARAESQANSAINRATNYRAELARRYNAGEVPELEAAMEAGKAAYRAAIEKGRK